MSSDSSKSRRRFTVDSLFTDHRPQAVGVSDLPTAKEIRLDRIMGDPDQPRRTFDPERLEELAASIQREGVLQPIVVRYDDAQDIYVIVHGERRWRAAQLAGLVSIPAVVRDVPEERRLIHQLMENVVRDDLNAIDRAAALRALRTQLGNASWDDVAEAVGIRRSRLFQLLGTEKLPSAIQEDIRSGRLSEKQSRALQGLGPAHTEALRDVIVADDIAADEAMRIARLLKAEALPDDARVVAEVIARIRSAKSPARRELDAETLLAAIADAASGGKDEQAVLKRMVARQRVPKYKAERLSNEVHAVARSLARMPAEEIGPGSHLRDQLTALARAIDALIGKR